MHNLARMVTTKIEEEDFRGAIRLASSDYTLAAFSEESYKALQAISTHHLTLIRISYQWRSQVVAKGANAPPFFFWNLSSLDWNLYLTQQSRSESLLHSAVSISALAS